MREHTFGVASEDTAFGGMAEGRSEALDELEQEHHVRKKRNMGKTGRRQFTRLEEAHESLTPDSTPSCLERHHVCTLLASSLILVLLFLPWSSYMQPTQSAVPTYAGAEAETSSALHAHPSPQPPKFGDTCGDHLLPVDESFTSFRVCENDCEQGKLLDCPLKSEASMLKNVQISSSSWDQYVLKLYDADPSQLSSLPRISQVDMFYGNMLPIHMRVDEVTGIFVNVGRTIVFRDHPDASDYFGVLGDITHVPAAAAKAGYDSIQYLEHCEGCMCDFELLLTRARGNTACPQGLEFRTDRKKCITCSSFADMV
ncbi:MAG: hypothetical protein SGPRY_007760 [Prymnesium sp.]